ncbi:MAG: hypothetical protein ACI9AD_001543 [Nitriliruptoraceae bacterium]|jgi:hypothetical protein
MAAETGSIWGSLSSPPLGQELAVMNRMDPPVGLPKDLWDNHGKPLTGWHPARPSRGLAYRPR